MSKLDGKVALITGGGSGIGLAIARAFLDAGARVAITGRNKDKLKQAADSLQAGDRVFQHAADVASAEQVQAFVKQVADRWGKIDILVNNAGVNVKLRGVRDLTPESWRTQLQTNLDGPFFCVNAVLPLMQARKDGVIININSTSGKRASLLGGAAYSAGKFGLHAFALCLAEELRETGIRVSTIYPGEVDTPILENRPRPVSEEHRQKMLRPEDIAAAALFIALLSPHASIPELVMKPTVQSFL